MRWRTRFAVWLTAGLTGTAIQVVMWPGDVSLWVHIVSGTLVGVIEGYALVRMGVDW